VQTNRALVRDSRMGPGSFHLGRVHVNARLWVGDIEPNAHFVGLNGVCATLLAFRKIGTLNDEARTAPVALGVHCGWSGVVPIAELSFCQVAAVVKLLALQATRAVRPVRRRGARSTSHDRHAIRRQRRAIAQRQTTTRPQRLSPRARPFPKKIRAQLRRLNLQRRCNASRARRGASLHAIQRRARNLFHFIQRCAAHPPIPARASRGKRQNLCIQRCAAHRLARFRAWQDKTRSISNVSRSRRRVA
jgi:hypothetical protein